MFKFFNISNEIQNSHNMWITTTGLKWVTNYLNDILHDVCIWQMLTQLSVGTIDNNDGESRKKLASLEPVDPLFTSLFF